MLTYHLEPVGIIDDHYHNYYLAYNHTLLVHNTIAKLSSIQTKRERVFVCTETKKEREYVYMCTCV